MPNLAQSLEAWLRTLAAQDVTNLFLFILMGVFALAVLFSLLNRAHGFVHYAPNLLTTVGILGTFIGIVIGLLDFKVGNNAEIQESIGPLLEGLKTAFITSLAGMFAAITFKSIESTGWLRLGRREEVPGGVGPEEIYHEIHLQREAMDNLAGAIVGEEESTLITQIRLLRLENRDELKQQRETLERLVRTIAGEDESTLITQIKLLRGETGDALRDLNNIAQAQREFLANVSLVANKQTQAFEAFSESLWRKLDEFAEMLSKSATEQVIEALREVIKDFNQNLTEQFGENFKELNAAVARLIGWQENYRTQLEQMGQQYAQGVQAITQTETSVAHISEESKQIPVAMGELKTVLETTQHQLNELERHLEAFRDMRDRAVEAVPQIKEQMDGMVKDVSTAVKDAGEQIMTASQTVNLAIVTGAKEFETRVHEQMEGMANGVSSSVKAASDQIVNAGQEVNSTILQGAKEFQDSFNKTNQGLVSASDQLANNSERIREQLEDTVKDINAHVREMVDVVKDNTGSLGETLTKSNADLQNNIKEVQFQVTDAIEGMQKRLEGTLEEVFQAQTRETGKVFNGIEEELARALGRTNEAVNKQMVAMDEAMQQELERVIGQLGQNLAAISEKFTKDYSDLTNQMSSVVNESRRFGGNA